METIFSGQTITEYRMMGSTAYNGRV